MSMPEDTIAPISNCFWDLDYFKYTVKRTEDGLLMCNELMKCIQERADVEKEYAKRLKTWAKKWNDFHDKGPEYGTNKSTLKGCLDEADKVADIHLEIKDRLLNNVQTSIKDWRNENYKKQMVGGCKEARAFEDDFRKAQKPWAKRLERVLKCKKDYYTACKLEKTAINQGNNARNGSEYSLDQMKKLQEKCDKCRKDVDTNRKSYQLALEDLTSYNARYVEDMTEVYKRTQDFEEKRLKFFKKVLYDMHASLDLTQKKTIPDIYSQLRQTVDLSDSAKDLKWWSQYRGIDMTMNWPAYEEYVTEFHSIHRKEKSKGAFLSGTSDGVMLTAIQPKTDLGSTTVQPKTDLGSTAIQPKTDLGSTAIQPKSDLYAIPAKKSQPPPAYSESPFGDDDSEGEVEVKSPEVVGVKVKALYNYVGQEGDELSFKAGEIFIKVKDRDAQGWCTGKKDGRIGLFPDSYVEDIKN